MRKLSSLLCTWVLATLIAAFASIANANVPRFNQVAPGVYRSAQPETADDFAKLAQLGIKRVVDLQYEDAQFAQENAWATAAGLVDFHYPMWSDYPDEQKVGEILAMMKNADKEPILIHCQAGQDRTGLIVALYRVHVMGWDADKARDEMLNMGFHWYYVNLEWYWEMHMTKGSQFIPANQ